MSKLAAEPSTSWTSRCWMAWTLRLTAKVSGLPFATHLVGHTTYQAFRIGPFDLRGCREAEHYYVVGRADQQSVRIGNWP
jgi:hypothetical protein